LKTFKAVLAEDQKDRVQNHPFIDELPHYLGAGKTDAPWTPATS
jgi:hypothetical protein